LAQLIALWVSSGRYDTANLHVGFGDGESLGREKQGFVGVGGDHGALEVRALDGD
jgi:hypothetical protein